MNNVRGGGRNSGRGHHWVNKEFHGRKAVKDRDGAISDKLIGVKGEKG